MKVKVEGEIVEMTKKKVWRSGGSKTPTITLPKEIVGDRNEVQMTVIRKKDGRYAIIIH